MTGFTVRALITSTVVWGVSHGLAKVGIPSPTGSWK